MFCQDAQGIFDEHYPGAVRDVLGFDGWGHANEKNILDILDMLYWYRKSRHKNKCDLLIERIYRHSGLFTLRKVIKQTLHTINGLLCKKFMVFGPEISSYHGLADQTASIFLGLAEEYSGIEPDPDIVQPFVELKRIFNFTKEIFYKGTSTDSSSWLDWKFQNQHVREFFNLEFRALKATINSMKRLSDSDYTESPAWFFRSTTFCQTRNLGYLPPSQYDRAVMVFRDTVSRPVEDLDPELDHLIRVAVTDRLQESDIRPGFLDNPEGPEEKVLAEEVLSHIELDLKGTASFSHTVTQGGKLEDARVAIQRIRENNWSIPVRDLKTNEILSSISYDSDDEAHWNRLLFWYAYQISLNWCAQRGLLEEELYYSFLLPNEEEFELDVMESSIVHIMEPGKIRDLVKGTGEITWALTPAAKIFQAALALLPEHKAGLQLAAHDWAHSRRISSESDESGFIFDPETGKLRGDIVHIFKDWTQSTDYIGKRVGLAHLGAFAHFIGFPPAYFKLVTILIREPQPVREVSSMRMIIEGNNQGSYTMERLEWNGSINEGFMMGMPITKVILHLIHVSERAIVKEFLRREGISLRPGFKGPKPYQEHVHIPRTVPSNPLLST